MSLENRVESLVPAQTVGPENGRAILSRLAHDLRQPLSGIESIAYYLDMVLSDAEPDIAAQCATLRRLVEQAGWLIEDATLAARLEGLPAEPFDLRALLVDAGASMALHDERNIELDLPTGATWAVLPLGLAHQFLDHLLSFFRGPAQAQDPIRIHITPAEDHLVLEVSAAVDAQADELPKLLDPEGHPGGVRRVLEVCGGSLTAVGSRDVFSVRIRLAAADQAA
jgi:hypothetical protein